jgi:hypothetical protein
MLLSLFSILNLQSLICIHLLHAIGLSAYQPVFYFRCKAGKLFFHLKMFSFFHRRRAFSYRQVTFLVPYSFFQVNSRLFKDFCPVTITTLHVSLPSTNLLVRF